MAIIIPGKTICKLCSQRIMENQEIAAFPGFIAEMQDPLSIFSDAAFHKECFTKHPLAAYAIKRLQEYELHTPPKDRQCWVCHRDIQHPDEYFSFHHLTDGPDDFLFRFNYAQFHRSCVKDFYSIKEVIARMEQVLTELPVNQNTAIRMLLPELKKLVT